MCYATILLHVSWLVSLFAQVSHIAVCNHTFIVATHPTHTQSSTYQQHTRAMHSFPIHFKSSNTPTLPHVTTTRLQHIASLPAATLGLTRPTHLQIPERRCQTPSSPHYRRVQAGLREICHELEHKPLRMNRGRGSDGTAMGGSEMKRGRDCKVKGQ